MAKKKDETQLLVDLLARYDQARTAAKEAENEKDELNKQIKLLLGNKEIVEVGNWRVTYRPDKDKVIKKFDEEKLQRKEPKVYEKYVNSREFIETVTEKYTIEETVPGTRRLTVGLKEE